MLSCDAESLLSFSCRVATEKEDISSSLDASQHVFSHVRTLYIHVNLYGARDLGGHEIESTAGPDG